MNLLDFFKKIFSNKKNTESLLLDTPKNTYQKLVSSDKIQSILNNIPEDLTQIEKAYYIYLELGKILNEDPKFVFNDYEKCKQLYNNKINKKFYGICKSMSELYGSILSDKKINIHSELVRRHPESEVSHIDNIIKVDGKYYICNLIADLSRIKTSRRVNHFCYDLTRTENLEMTENVNRQYLYMLESHYGKIDHIPRNEIEAMDKKLNYSFVVPKYDTSDTRGLYTEDTLDLLSSELNNPELFKEYVLKNRDIDRDFYLQYKLEYIFENINDFTKYNNKNSQKNNNMYYLETIRYYMKIIQKTLYMEDLSRIKAYALTNNENFEKMISIIKLLPPQGSEKIKNNTYYLYSPSAMKFIRQSPIDLKYLLDNLDKGNLKIVGFYDKFNPTSIDALEL